MSTVEAAYNRVSRFGWHYIVPAVLGVEGRGVAASMDYGVLSFMSAGTSGNVGLTCAVFRR